MRFERCAIVTVIGKVTLQALSLKHSVDIVKSIASDARFYVGIDVTHFRIVCRLENVCNGIDKIAGGITIKI